MLPHLYIEQSPFTVPRPLRGQIKRPDYLVGIPGIGTVAFDVKAKRTYPEGLLFDVGEVQKLRTFARLFHLTVYFACLDPEGGSMAWWVRLDQLDPVPARRIGRKLVLSLPLAQAQPVDMRADFYRALVAALTLA